MRFQFHSCCTILWMTSFDWVCLFVVRMIRYDYPPVFAACQSGKSHLHGEELQEETCVRCVQGEHWQPWGFLQGWVHVSFRSGSRPRDTTDQRCGHTEHLTEMSSPWLPSLCLSKLPVRVNHAPYLCSPLTVCRMQGCSSQDMRSKGKPSLKSSQITRFAFLLPLSKLCSCVRGSHVLSGVSHVHWPRCLVKEGLPLWTANSQVAMSDSVMW